LKPRLTSWLWVLIIAGATTALFGFLRSWGTAASWKLLLQLNLGFSPAYLLASGILWLLLGLAAVVSIFTHWRRAPWLIRGSALAVVASYWVDRLLLTRSDAARANQGFALWFSLLALGGTFIILQLPEERQYFQAQPGVPPRQKETDDESTRK
jgi:hypothetical protein